MIRIFYIEYTVGYVGLDSNGRLNRTWYTINVK